MVTMRRTTRSIRYGLIVLWAVAVSATVQAASPSGGSQAAVPLPRGVRGLAEPVRVDLGASTLDVQSFIVRMDEEALIAFYRKALPEAGWRIERLPWQADQEEAASRWKRALTYHRDALDEAQREEAQERLAKLEQGKDAMRRQLYATKGVEHVIVNLWPGASKETTVFINHWYGGRQWLGVGARPPTNSLVGPASALGKGAAEPNRSLHTEGSSQLVGGLPMTNVCCSAEEVPDLAGVLPFSIPRYPGAKAVARATPQGGVSTTVLLRVPGEERAVTDFYRSEMPVNGWKLTQEAVPDEGTGTGVRRLVFQRPDRICELTIAPVAPGKADAGEGHTLVTISVRPRVAGVPR